jgi:RNase P/RNase MRP subunit p30
MAYFDLVAVPKEMAGEAAKRLGFRRIFCLGSDVELLEDMAQQPGRMKRIVAGSSAEALSRGIRRSDAVAALATERSLNGKELELLREMGKPLLIPLAQVTCAGEVERGRALRRAKGAVREAMMHKAPLAIASMAGSVDCMMSAQQMLGIAKLLGMSDRVAERALGALGEAL